MDSSNGHGHRDSTGRLDPTRGTRSVESGIPFLAVASRVGTEFGCFVSVFAFGCSRPWRRIPGDMGLAERIFRAATSCLRSRGSLERVGGRSGRLLEEIRLRSHRVVAISLADVKLVVLVHRNCPVRRHIPLLLNFHCCPFTSFPPFRSKSKQERSAVGGCRTCSRGAFGRSLYILGIKHHHGGHSGRGCRRPGDCPCLGCGPRTSCSGERSHCDDRSWSNHQVSCYESTLHWHHAIPRTVSTILCFASHRINENPTSHAPESTSMHPALANASFSHSFTSTG